MKKTFITKKSFARYAPFLFLACVVAPHLTFGAEATFIPLTNIPGISTSAGAPSLPIFLNGLYRLCIGAAAVIAIVQIMRAGVAILQSSGSITSNSEAKGLISNAIIGLVLVLSPYVVFSVINPSILKLDFDVSGLQTASRVSSSTNTGTLSTQPEHLLQCADVTKKVIVPNASENACTNLGEGYVNSDCCANTPYGQTCCAFHPSLVKTPEILSPGEVKNGTYTITAYTKDASTGEADACLITETHTYSTSAACVAQINSYGTNANTAISNNCGGTTSSATPVPAATFAKIRSLPSCQQ